MNDVLRGLLDKLLPVVNAATGSVGCSALIMYLFHAEGRSVCLTYPQIGSGLLVVCAYAELSRRHKPEG